jgi:hypothetical protein
VTFSSKDCVSFCRRANWLASNIRICERAVLGNNVLCYILRFGYLPKRSIKQCLLIHQIRSFSGHSWTSQHRKVRTTPGERKFLAPDSRVCNDSSLVNGVVRPKTCAIVRRESPRINRTVAADGKGVIDASCDVDSVDACELLEYFHEVRWKDVPGTTLGVFRIRACSRSSKMILAFERVSKEMPA